jgi:hypothetical protein
MFLEVHNAISVIKFSIAKELIVFVIYFTFFLPFSKYDIDGPFLAPLK